MKLIIFFLILIFACPVKGFARNNGRTDSVEECKAILEKIKSKDPNSYYAEEGQKVINLRSKLKLILEADKEIYRPGELVMITFTWTNVSGEDIVDDFGGFNFDIKDKKGELLWANVSDSYRPKKIKLLPNESYRIQKEAHPNFSELSNGKREFAPGAYFISVSDATWSMDEITFSEKDCYAEPVNTVTIVVE